MNLLQGHKTCLAVFSFRTGSEQAQGQALTPSRQLPPLPSGVQPCAKAAGSGSSCSARGPAHSCHGAVPCMPQARGCSALPLAGRWEQSMDTLSALTPRVCVAPATPWCWRAHSAGLEPEGNLSCIRRPSTAVFSFSGTKDQMYYLMFPNSLYKRVFCYSSLFGLWVENIMYIKLLINAILRTSFLVFSVTPVQRVLIFLIRQLQLLFMKKVLCQLLTVFFRGTFKHSVTS